MTMRTTQLADILSEEEILSDIALEEAVRVARDAGVPLACHLLDAGLMQEEDLFFLLSRRGVAPAIPRDHVVQAELSADLKHRVPAAVARRFGVLPMEIDPKLSRLAVAMVDPADKETVERLRRAVGVEEVRSYLARYSTIVTAIERAYVSDGGQQVLSRSTGELERGDTQVELIPGKVSLDPSLFKEMEAISPTMAKDSRRSRSARPAPAMPAAKSERRLPAARAVVEPRRPAERPRRAADEDLTRVRRVPTPGGAVPKARRMEVELQPLAARRQEVPHPRMPELPRVAAAEAPKSEPVWPKEETRTEPRTPSFGSEEELVRRLEAAVGVLVSMLEERVEAGSAVASEFTYLARLTAREAGLAERSVRAASVAGALVGLDAVLRKSLELAPNADVAMIFAREPQQAGVLNPTLRTLGGRMLGLRQDDEKVKEPSAAFRVTRLVADFLALRSSDVDADLDTIFQLLRTGGADASLMDALERAVEKSEGSHDTEPHALG